MSEDSGPAEGAHWAIALNQHLTYKASNPEAAARAAKRKKEFLANKNRHRLTAEQLKVIFPSPPPPSSRPDDAAMFKMFLSDRAQWRALRRTVKVGGEEAVEQQEGEGNRGGNRRSKGGRGGGTSGGGASRSRRKRGAGRNASKHSGRAIGVDSTKAKGSGGSRSSMGIAEAIGQTP